MAKDDEIRAEITEIIKTWTKGYDANINQAATQIMIVMKREQSALLNETIEILSDGGN